MTPEQAAALRAEFSPETIGKLPRVTCKACSDRSKTCTDHRKGKCRECGAYVSESHIHLDYVGHAAVTDRLLQVDPEWSWEPFAVGADGLPAAVAQGGEVSLWIRLTVAGVTRPAVGTAPSGSFELAKQLVSDAIRNGAMRFGVALDLWSKEDLGHGEPDEPISQSDLADLVAVFDGITDEQARAKTKRAFQREFGKPAELRASRVQAARDWLAEVPF